MPRNCLAGCKMSSLSSSRLFSGQVEAARWAHWALPACFSGQVGGCKMSSLSSSRLFFRASGGCKMSSLSSSRFVFQGKWRLQDELIELFPLVFRASGGCKMSSLSSSRLFSGQVEAARWAHWALPACFSGLLVWSSLIHCGVFVCYLLFLKSSLYSSNNLFVPCFHFLRWKMLHIWDWW